MRGFLAAWDRALTQAGPIPVILTADPDGKIGDWQGRQAANSKMAFLTGAVRAARDVATTPAPAEQAVSWKNGASRLVPVVSAATAVTTFARSPQISGSCHGCDPITVMEPRLIRESISTATGPATVPAWSFAVAGSGVRVTMVAVIPDAEVRLVPGLAPGQIWDYQQTAALDADGSLVISLGATPDGACGGRYSGRATESAHAVAIDIDFIQTRPPASASRMGMQSGGGCPGERSVDIALAHPLAGRIVIDGRSGMVLPML